MGRRASTKNLLKRFEMEKVEAAKSLRRCLDLMSKNSTVLSEEEFYRGLIDYAQSNGPWWVYRDVEQLSARCQDCNNFVTVGVRGSGNWRDRPVCGSAAP